MTRSRPNPPHGRSAQRRVVRRLLGIGALALAAVTTTPTLAGAQTTRGGGFPGGSGTLIGRSGSTLQIEGFAGTSKVLVTSTTQYRQVEDTDSSAITKGACIRVTGSGTTSEGITATSVTVLDDKQACSANANAGRGGGGFPGGGQPPNGGSLPNGGTFPDRGSLPNGGSPPDGGTLPEGGFPGGGGGGVTGKVKSTNGDTVVVVARVPEQSSGGNAQPKLKKQKVSVTLADSTTVSHTVDATEAVLVVGSCVTAQGTADSVGTVTAQTVTVSAPEDGSCTRGFGGFGGPGGFGAPPAQSTT